MSNGPQTWVVSRLIDRFLDRGVEEALDRRIEVVKRHQDADFARGNGFRRGLEGVEHRPFAARQMQARRSGLANGFEDLLDQQELIRRERVVPDEILLVLERTEGHAAVLERELALEDVALGHELRFEHILYVRTLRQKAGLNDLVDVGARQRQGREEAPLNLGEILLLRPAHVAQNGVHVLLGGDDHPRAATAERPQFFRDRLQVEHQMRVGPDEPADFVDEERDPMPRPFRVQVFVHPLAEILDRQGEVALGPFDPSDARRLALPEGLAERLDDLVLIEFVGVPFVLPSGSCQPFEGGMESLQLALAVEIALHVGDVRVVAAIALQFVQDLQEDSQDQVASGAASVVRLALDVEQDDVGIGGDGALDVGKERGVPDLALEEFDRPLGSGRRSYRCGCSADRTAP